MLGNREQGRRQSVVESLRSRGWAAYTIAIAGVQKLGGEPVAVEEVMARWRG